MKCQLGFGCKGMTKRQKQNAYVDVVLSDRIVCSLFQNIVSYTKIIVTNRKVLMMCHGILWN